LFIWLLPCVSWAQTSTSKYDECEQYDQLIVEAVEKHFPRDFQYPLAWRAQIYQESLCKKSARSHVGAQGLAQIMPSTERTIEGWRRVLFDPYNPKDAINYGAYYQSRKMKTWNRRGRTPLQVFELGWASYNSGTGNVLKAQRKCANAKTWDKISPCQRLVTGRHASETIGYVSRIKRHWKAMAAEQLPAELR